MRNLNRHRKSLVRDCATVKNRLLKVLVDGNCKLASVITDVFGQNGLAILREMSVGNTAPDHLISFVTHRVKNSHEVILKSLTNCFRKDHIF